MLASWSHTTLVHGFNSCGRDIHSTEKIFPLNENWVSVLIFGYRVQTRRSWGWLGWLTLTIRGNVLATQWGPQGFLNPKGTLNHPLYTLVLWADSLKLHIARTTPTLPSQKKKYLGYHTRQGTLTTWDTVWKKGNCGSVNNEKWKQQIAAKAYDSLQR